MKVLVTSHYDDTEQVFQGPQAHVYQQLLEAFPWLTSPDAGHHNDLEALVEHLDASQAVSAEILGENDDKLTKAEDNLFDEDLEPASEVAIDMLGFNPGVHPAFAAAAFLTGKGALSAQQIRQALYDQDDYIDAAIQAYKLPDNEESRQALRAIMSISGVNKAVSSEQLPAGTDIEPGTPDAADAADAVRRAFKLKKVKVAHLDGKHSKGSLIARDGKMDRTFLLKPGSGGQSPAAGAAEEPASQSRREAAFWQLAEDWGVGESVPRADLVLIDGREYAAIQMLPFSWKSLQKRLDRDPGAARQAFATYRDRGIVHKWAVLDFVLGNPDRHGDNMMISEDGRLLGLVDHGSAFAGPGFDPARDQDSFVPFYLRAWTGPRFNKLSTQDKLKKMPLVNNQLRDDLRSWLDGIHADQISGICYRFGIDPQPSLDRLAKLKVLASKLPVDEAINRLWVTT